MARLIDAEKYSEVLKTIMSAWSLSTPETNKGIGALKIALNELESQPTVDVVEVVRCKDCRHKDFRYYDKESVFCYMSGKYRHIDDFCSYGAKVDGGDKE